MHRLSFKIPTVLYTSTVNKSVCNGCMYPTSSARRQSSQAQPPPPMSQKFEGEQSAGQPGAGGAGGRRGAAGKKVALAVGITAVSAAVAGGLFVLDPLGLFIEKKPLAPAPTRCQGNASDNDPTGSAQLEAPATLSRSERSSSRVNVSAAAQQLTAKIAQTNSDSPEPDTSSITTIAEKSIRLLLSGNETADHEAKSRMSGESNEHGDCESAELVKQQKIHQEEEKRQQFNTMKAQRNEELERTLSQELGDVAELADKAITLNQLALAASQEHTAGVRRAMSAETEGVAQEHWTKICESRELSVQRLADAQSVGSVMEQQLATILDLIERYRSDEMTSANPSLSSSEIEARQIAESLAQSTALLRDADTIDNVMKPYYSALKDQRQELLGELENLPNFKPGAKASGRFSDEELAELVARAHRRVLQLKRQLRGLEFFEPERHQEILEEEREESNREYEEQLQHLKKQRRSSHENETNSQLASLQEQHEKQMREETTRQSLAANTHLTDMLAMQKAQLVSELNEKITERVKLENALLSEGLTERNAKLCSLEAVTREKANLEESLIRVGQLIRSAQCFRHAITTDPVDGPEYEMLPISAAVENCRSSSPDDKFVKVVLDSIPDHALCSGIYTVTSLARRFDNMFNECKKNALFPSFTNIFTSSLSRLYGKLVLFSIKPKYSRVEDFYNCGTEGMDTKDLLVQAQYFMDRQLLSAAVKCMVQLEGLPQRLAQDWLNEARLFLEVHQASEALFHYAMLQGVSKIV